MPRKVDIKRFFQFERLTGKTQAAINGAENALLETCRANGYNGKGCD